MAVKRWTAVQGDKSRSRSIAERFNIPPFAAHLLLTRSITDDGAIESMLSPARFPLSDPMELPDMDKAAARIRRAVEDNELVAVYGDYDVDGVTATSLLYTCFEGLGMRVMYMLPSRDEDGYGLSFRVIDKMNEHGVSLIVTVDNGVTAVDEIAYAASLGIDTVVTDHHRPTDRLPQAVALVDPHLSEKELCPLAGVGVAFKLACALEGDTAQAVGKYADLVALGSVADVVPLKGENRALVTLGIAEMRKGNRTGLRLLMLNAGIERTAVDAAGIAFSLAPRINSAGRMGKPDKTVRLMISDDIDQCRSIAEELESDNINRGSAYRKILEETWNTIRERPELLCDRVVVVCGEGWNHGVVGIAAARLCETLGKPCIILASEGDIARGSGRCFGDFSLHAALTSCAELFVAYGGHRSAAGMTLHTRDIEQLRIRLNEYAAQYDLEHGGMPVQELPYDCELPLRTVTLSLVDDIACLEPFGADNPRPTVLLRNVKVTGIRPLGRGAHHRFTLSDGAVFKEVVCFGMNKSSLPCGVGDMVDCLVEPGINEYNGELQLSLKVKDMRLSGIDAEAIIEGGRLFERMMRGEELTEAQVQALLCDRAMCATVYRYITAKDFSGQYEMLYERLKGGGLSYAQMLTALHVLASLDFIELEEDSGCCRIYAKQQAEKTSLEDSPIMKRLRSC